MDIVEILTPFLSLDAGAATARGGKNVSSATPGAVFEVVSAQLGEAKGIKIAKQLFGIDLTANFALATATVVEVTAEMSKLQARSDIPQTEAYWMVDVWGRTEALKALIVDLGRLIDADQPTGFTASGFCSRAAVLVLGCHDLLVLVHQNLSTDMLKRLGSLVAHVKSAQAGATAAIGAHITDL